MSVQRAYLEEKAALPENEWLKREPRTTHLEILNAVRCFRVECEIAGKTAYDDEAEQAVEGEAGDLPEHRYHAHPERHRLTVQLGAEVYIAQCICHDEENIAQAEKLRAEGFVSVDEAEVGKAYDIALATLYSGYEYPSYGSVKERCRFAGYVDGDQRPFFLLPRARKKGYVANEHALIREVAS